MTEHGEARLGMICANHITDRMPTYCRWMAPDDYEYPLRLA